MATGCALGPASRADWTAEIARATQTNDVSNEKPGALSNVKAGDVLVSHPTAVREHEISVIPTRRTRCLRRTTLRSTTGVPEAKAMGVDAWLTEDHRARGEDCVGSHTGHVASDLCCSRQQPPSGSHDGVHDSCGTAVRATTIAPNLADLTLTQGVYWVGAAASNLTGTLTLDAQGNATQSSFSGCRARSSRCPRDREPGEWRERVQRRVAGQHGATATLLTGLVVLQSIQSTSGRAAHRARRQPCGSRP
jgi:hypothetical protein